MMTTMMMMMMMIMIMIDTQYRCVDDCACMQLSASCRIRRIYFAERFHDDSELPADWSWNAGKLSLPLSSPRRAGTESTTRSIFDNCPPITFSSAR